MAPREDVRRFVRGLFEPNAAALPIPPKMPTPSSYVPIEQIEDVVVRPYSESRFALLDAPTVAAAPETAAAPAMPALTAAAAPAMPAPLATEPPPSYMDALQRAQAQDRATLAGQAMLGSAEQIARIASRGVYQPTGGARLPSAVAELQQQREAVAEYLAQQRGLRAETRQERASEADLQLRRGQAARDEARAKADELRAAVEAAESPERVEKLRAETLAAFQRANLYSEQAAQVARGKQRKLMASGPPVTQKTLLGKAPRPLPATETRELADFAVAEQELSDLLKSFKDKNMAGAAGRAGETTTSLLGLRGTDAAAYMADARRTMQAVGTILEGGKLAAGDEVKYARMLPQAGDSANIAQQKVDGLRKLLSSLKASRIEAFRGGGFEVAGAPGAPPVAALTAAPAAPSKDDIARAAFAEFRRAQDANAPPEQLARLRAAAEQAIKEAGGN